MECVGLNYVSTESVSKEDDCKVFKDVSQSVLTLRLRRRIRRLIVDSILFVIFKTLSR